MLISKMMRAALLSGAATCCATPVLAQEAPPAASADAAPPAENQAADIVVTGSRIRRPDYEAPNPIVSVDVARLQQSGNTNVTDFLRRVPALTNSIDSTRSAGNSQEGQIGQAGLNLLDLRGLGTNRTLVLVNGRRHVSSQLDTAAVDINVIPTDLIERVDVLTGSASAVYGADGVSGVVNFILKRDVDGILARAQAGISEQGDAGNRFASLIAGRNFFDGRANVTLAYEYFAQDALANDDRDYLRSDNRVFFVNNANYVAGQAGSYIRIPQTDNRYASTYGDPAQAGGSFQNIFKIGDRFYRGDGQLFTFGSTAQTFDYTQGGDDSPVAGYIGDILPNTRRHAVNALAHFDVSDAFKISLEGKFVEVKARTFGSYSGTYSSPDGSGYNAPITLDNPFIPQRLLDAALAAGVTTLQINRNNFDLPRRGEEDRRRTWRGVLDVTGRISEHATYDVSYTYGRTDVRATKLNDRQADRFPEALDAVRDAGTGQIVCRSATARAAGCLPINTFGAFVADPRAFDYFLIDVSTNARLEQHVASASLSGDFGQFFTLPGGPVQFALGAEYRSESSRSRADANFTPANIYQFDEPFFPSPSFGKFDVWEAYGELNAPILKDRPFAYLLSVGAAGRLSDYSTVGRTEAYQFNAIYAPIEDVSFRGSYGRSVRAPNIAEVFRPTTGLSDFIVDPCYLSERGQGSQFRAANCVALITAAGGNPASFTRDANPDANVNVVGIETSNPNLKAEEADTWTAGVVLRPSFIPQLQIAIDWYDINLKGAINRATPAQLASLCVDLESIDNPYCAAISRRAGTGYINGYTVSPQNVSAFRTAGLEVNASYAVSTASAGRFDLNLVAGYLDKLDLIPLPGAAVIDNRDQPFRPKWNVAFSPTWSLDEVTLAYTLRWQNGTRRFARIDTDGRPDFVDPQYFRFKPLWQHDIQVQWRTADGFSFYAGVNNLGNQRPDIGFETNVPISPLGRYFYAGARIALTRTH